MSLNLYDLLDVDPDASEDAIKKAWKNAIADLGPGDRRFRAYNQAAEVLLDRERRAAYDAELSAGAPVTPPPDLQPVVPSRPDQEPASAGEREGALVAEPGRELDGDAEPDPETDPDLEPDPEPEDEAADAEREPVATWLLVAVGLVTAAVLAVTTWSWTTTDRGDEAVLDTEENAAAALTAAETAAVPVLSYDYRTFDEDVVDAESYMTTDHRVEHSELMNDLRPDATAQKLVVESEFKGSGIVRVTDDRADILVLVNQVVRKAGSEPFVLPVWATLQMVEEDGTWLVDKVVNEGAVGA